MIHYSRLIVLLFATAAWAQDRWFDVYPQLQQYLQLTNTQVTAISQANRRFTEWTLEKQIRIATVQREIAEETARSPLDPMALGVRYAEVEAICREVRERESDVQKSNVNLLNDAQKARLKSLEDAWKLLPTISEAQAARLLSGSGLVPRIAIPNSRITDISIITPALAPSFGCYSTSPILTGTFLPPTATGDTAQR
jgi:hypothetical protein